MWLILTGLGLWLLPWELVAGWIALVIVIKAVTVDNRKSVVITNDNEN